MGSEITKKLYVTSRSSRLRFWDRWRPALNPSRNSGQEKGENKLAILNINIREIQFRRMLGKSNIIQFMPLPVNVNIIVFIHIDVYKRQHV